MTIERVGADDVLSSWSEGKSFRQKLMLPEEKLEVLIPPKLRGVIPDGSMLDVIRLDQWIGRMDDEILPVLSVLIVNRHVFNAPIEFQERGDNNWSEAINTKRAKAIELSKLSANDRVIASFIADNSWNEYGIFVHSFILSEELRGRGIGEDFYRNFEELAQVLGFKYLYGVNDHDNIGFFLKSGRYLLDQVRTERKNLFHPSVVDSITTVKFLDQEFEGECVKPEFLRQTGE